MDLDIGVIDRIDIVPKTTEKGEKFNRVFIHFKKWLDNENATNSRERLLNGKEIKVIYDDPWFWKVSALREPVKKQNKNKLPALNVNASAFVPVTAKALSASAPAFIPSSIAPALPPSIAPTITVPPIVAPAFTPRTPTGPPPPLKEAKLSISLEKIKDEPRVDEGLDIDYGVSSVPPPCNKPILQKLKKMKK